MQRRLTYIALGCGLFSLLSSTDALASIRLKIFFTPRAQGIVLNSGQSTGPVLGPATELDFSLHDKTVDFYVDQGGGLTHIGSGFNQVVNFYGPVTVSIKSSPRRLTLIGNYATHRIFGIINTDGSSSCSASLRYKLKPGSKLFHFEVPSLNIGLEAASIEPLNVRCQLSVE